MANKVEIINALENLGKNLGFEVSVSSLNRKKKSNILENVDVIWEISLTEQISEKHILSKYIFPEMNEKLVVAAFIFETRDMQTREQLSNLLSLQRIDTIFGFLVINENMKEKDIYRRSKKAIKSLRLMNGRQQLFSLTFNDVIEYVEENNFDNIDNREKIHRIDLLKKYQPKIFKEIFNHMLDNKDSKINLNCVDFDGKQRLCKNEREFFYIPAFKQAWILNLSRYFKKFLKTIYLKNHDIYESWTFKENYSIPVYGIESLSNNLSSQPGQIFLLSKFFKKSFLICKEKEKEDLVEYICENYSISNVYLKYLEE